MAHPVAVDEMAGQRRTAIPVPPVISTVDCASPPPHPLSTSPGPDGTVSTTLPMWRAWLTYR